MTGTPGKWTIWNTYRRLRAPEPNDVYGRTAIRNAPNGKVGDQFFLRARYPISPQVRFELGGALLLKGDFLKEHTEERRAGRECVIASRYSRPSHTQHKKPLEQTTAPK